MIKYKSTTLHFLARRKQRVPFACKIVAISLPTPPTVLTVLRSVPSWRLFSENDLRIKYKMASIVTHSECQEEKKEKKKKRKKSTEKRKKKKKEQKKKNEKKTTTS